MIKFQRNSIQCRTNVEEWCLKWEISKKIVFIGILESCDPLLFIATSDGVDFNLSPMRMREFVVVNSINLIMFHSTTPLPSDKRLFVTICSLFTCLSENPSSEKKFNI